MESVGIKESLGISKVIPNHVDQIPKWRTPRSYSYRGISKTYPMQAINLIALLGWLLKWSIVCKNLKCWALTYLSTSKIAKLQLTDLLFYLFFI